MIKTESASALIAALKRLGKLYLENAKYTAAEKITIFLGATALCIIVLILGLLAFLFTCFCIADLLATYLSPFWSYLIVTGIFILAIVVLCTFKNTLIFNPIARFISKLILDPPNQERHE